MDIYASFIPAKKPMLDRFAELTLLKLGLRIYWDQNGVDLDELEKTCPETPGEICPR